MRVATKIDIAKMQELMRFDEKNLKEYLYKELKKYYTRIIYHEKYLMAAGTGSICLLAHMDTVFKYQPVDFFHDQEKKVIWSPQGLGADDRAGIYSILEILSTGTRPHIIFTTDEEVGGIGARQLVTDYPNIKTIIPDMKFLIQLDRRGYNDSVYYECGNESFEDWINKFGFETAEGSYTDISILAPAWEMAAVNLSVGYYNEHEQVELLYYTYTLDTINKVLDMIYECSVGNGPEDTTYIEKRYDNEHCPICFKKLNDNNKASIIKYGLGVDAVCKECYSIYFKD